ncbi:MAG: NFACT RNA binding domain-containing protein [Nanoarchaeota archaeon]
MNITLHINKTIEQNAAHYFEAAKRAKRKLAGVEKTLVKYCKELENLQTQKEQQAQAHKEEEILAEQRAAQPKRWYHSFRWFITSEGFLAIGGRDAVSNEVLIKKHTEPTDLIFHTDMAGSPFFILKTEGKKPQEASCREVADATCTFSKAWKLGMSNQDVFYVTPEQVSKTAQSGEYLPRGGFMIRGKTTYLNNHINLAIGIDNTGFVMAGPCEAIKMHCKDYVMLMQGRLKPSDIAKYLAKKFHTNPDEILRALPAGGFKIK